MDELKVQKEKQKIPEAFGWKEEKVIFITEFNSCLEYLWKTINNYQNFHLIINDFNQ